MDQKPLRMEIAYHEAGHATACALFKELGVDIHMCNLTPDNYTFQGFVIYSFNQRRNKRQQFAQAIINISGAFATAIYKKDANAIKQGSGSDFDQFDDFIYKWNAEESLSDIVDFTKWMLRENWELVTRIAEKLNKSECIYGSEIKEISNLYNYDKEDFERILSTIKRVKKVA